LKFSYFSYENERRDLNTIPEPGSSNAVPKQPASDAEQDLATAYHEAGHAVVALSLGRSIEKLSIVRNSLRLGAVNLGSSRRGRRDDYFEKEALVLLAGLLSEARITGKLNWNGARQDVLNLRKLISARVGTEKAAERLERRLFDKTEHYLSQAGIWEAIEKIAKELLQHRSISGRSARHVYDQATKQS
jgi:ATP-dependent Zn protease